MCSGQNCNEMNCNDVFSLHAQADQLTEEQIAGELLP